MAWTFTMELQAARLRIRNVDANLKLARTMHLGPARDQRIADIWEQARKDRKFLKDWRTQQTWRRENDRRTATRA
jgi:hypothetical protein